MTPTFRNVATPAATALFLVCAVTGVALFFHWHPGFVHAAHEWLGLTFAAIALWHASRHWRALASYAKQPTAVSVAAVLLAASVTLMAVNEVGQPSLERTVCRWNHLWEIPRYARNGNSLFSLSS